MKKLRLLLFLLPVMVNGQQLPGTEIYLFDLTIKKKDITLSNPINITNHTGYDNQPFFHPDKPIIYYSSGQEDGRTDIMEYDMAGKSTRKITQTSEREYSPTVTPDGQFLSCIIQRDNGAQDLGKYPIGGGDPVVLINDLVVGYHAWIDQSNLLLFVLSDPLSLYRYNLFEKSYTIISTQIGRSLHKIPGTNSMSFVHKVSEQEWFVKRMNESGTIETIGPTLPGREDLTWTPDARLLMSDGEKVFWLKPGENQWTPANQQPSALRGFTRMAINKKGNKIAIVVSE